MNQYTSGGDIMSPPLKTTAMIASEAGISEKTAHREKQIARNLTAEA
jgi:hypothetical protein